MAEGLRDHQEYNESEVCQPSSAAGERVFSLLSNSFKENQKMH